MTHAFDLQTLNSEFPSNAPPYAVTLILKSYIEGDAMPES